MKQLLNTEEAIQLVLGMIALYFQPLHFAWWLWPVIFLSPDLSMAGYLINTRAGAACYNLAHHKGIAGILMIAGYFAHIPLLLFIGSLLYAHSCFDRMMGYGLKFPDSFNHTHLGMIGKARG